MISEFLSLRKASTSGKEFHRKPPHRNQSNPHYMKQKNCLCAHFILKVGHSANRIRGGLRFVQIPPAYWRLTRPPGGQFSRESEVVRQEVLSRHRTKKSTIQEPQGVVIFSSDLLYRINANNLGLWTKLLQSTTAESLYPWQKQGNQNNNIQKTENSTLQVDQENGL